MKGLGSRRRVLAALSLGALLAAGVAVFVAVGPGGQLGRGRREDASIEADRAAGRDEQRGGGQRGKDGPESLATAAPAGAADAAGVEGLAARMGILEPQERVEPPDVVGPALDGKTIGLSDFHGRVVFLNFWATWCVPCRVEMPAMERLYQEFKGQGFVILAVNVQEGEAAVRAFVEELKLTFAIVLDPEGRAARAYQVRGLPATYLIGRKQTIAGRAMGMREWDSPDGRAYVRALLERPG
ncbi:MAG: TlpA disulfide reductase family protein [Candidatus Methylomirabilales bacterium]